METNEQLQKRLADFAMASLFDFSGTAQQMLFKRYGNPQHKHFFTDYIIEWSVKNIFSWFPVESILIHKDFAGKLRYAFEELERAGLHNEINSIGAVYDLRNVAGSHTAPSIHCWGCAIDMNTEHNQPGTSGSWSLPFLEVMLLNGIFCGQNWTGRKVPDHFAMVNG